MGHYFKNLFELEFPLDGEILVSSQTSSNGVFEDKE
jgi:hypothetical protein